MTVGERCRCGEPPPDDSLVCPRCGREIYIRGDFRLAKRESQEPWLLVLVSALLVGASVFLDPPLLRLLCAVVGFLTFGEVLAVVWSGTLAMAITGSLLAVYSGFLLERPLSVIGLVLGIAAAVIGLVGRLMVVSRRSYIRRARSQLEMLERLLARHDRAS